MSTSSTGGCPATPATEWSRVSISLLRRLGHLSRAVTAAAPPGHRMHVVMNTEGEHREMFLVLRMSDTSAVRASRPYTTLHLGLKEDGRVQSSFLPAAHRSAHLAEEDRSEQWASYDPVALDDEDCVANLATHFIERSRSAPWFGAPV